MNEINSVNKIDAIANELTNISNAIKNGAYFGEIIEVGITELNKMFERINKEDEFNTILIVNSDGEAKIFGTNGTNYGQACKYIWQCLEDWNCLDCICKGGSSVFSPLSLLNECIEDRSFGDVLELYIKNYDGDFIRIMA